MNYIINSETVAILKKDKKTFIYNVENYKVINKTINRILNDNCLFYGSSLLGRKSSAQKILNIKYKVPINISDKNDLIFIQINSLRNKECLFLNINKIIDYKLLNNELIVRCIKNKIFKLPISKYSFEKMLIKGLILSNSLKEQLL